MIKAVLFVLNMMPILPLDGGRFIDTFLPPRLSQQFQKTEAYGTWVILLLLMTGILGAIMSPFVRSIMSAVASVVSALS